jgi:hypothetical protein
MRSPSPPHGECNLCGALSIERRRRSLSSSSGRCRDHLLSLLRGRSSSRRRHHDRRKASLSVRRCHSNLSSGNKRCLLLSSRGCHHNRSILLSGWGCRDRLLSSSRGRSLSRSSRGRCRDHLLSLLRGRSLSRRRHHDRRERLARGASLSGRRCHSNLSSGNKRCLLLLSRGCHHDRSILLSGGRCCDRLLSSLRGHSSSRRCHHDRREASSSRRRCHSNSLSGDKHCSLLSSRGRHA